MIFSGPPDVKPERRYHHEMRDRALFRPKCPNLMVTECGKSTVAYRPAAVPDLMAALQPHPERKSLDRPRRGNRIQTSAIQLLYVDL